MTDQELLAYRENHNEAETTKHFNFQTRDSMRKSLQEARDRQTPKHVTVIDQELVSYRQTHTETETQERFKFSTREVMRRAVKDAKKRIVPKETYIPDLKKKIVKALSKPKTMTDLCDETGASTKDVDAVLQILHNEKYNLISNGGVFEITGDLVTGGSLSIDLEKYENTAYRIGFCGDNHLGSKFERLDVLNALYDIFEKEGITDVFNTGNWIDGEARFNKYEIHTHGITPQIDYFVDKYPQREGITTHFIAGDDHEGWYVQREKINIGEYAQMMAEKAGRNDLKYLGYVESDVEFKVKNGRAIMKVMHPGGGSAYALSYSPQKLIESFSGGEKPQILLIGHYHKFDYIHYRNIFCIQTGCTQDQTIFMRKKKLQAHVGGGIFEFQVSQDGSVNRGKVEWIPFYDVDYYKRQGYYR